MSTLPVVIQPRARREIEAALEWLTQWSPVIAARWLDGLTKAILSLGANPERYPLAPESARCPWEVREKLYGKRRNVYRILFVIESGQVSVLAVHHAARDHWQP